MLRFLPPFHLTKYEEDFNVHILNWHLCVSWCVRRHSSLHIIASIHGQRKQRREDRRKIKISAGREERRKNEIGKMFILLVPAVFFLVRQNKKASMPKKIFPKDLLIFRALARKAESSACWWAFTSMCASSAEASVVLVGKSGKALAMKSSLMLRALFSVSSAFGEACGGLEFIFIIFIQHPYFFARFTFSPSDRKSYAELLCVLCAMARETTMFEQTQYFHSATSEPLNLLFSSIFFLMRIQLGLYLLDD